MKEHSDERLNLAGFLLVSILGLAAGAGLGVGLSQDFATGLSGPSTDLTQSAAHGVWSTTSQKYQKRSGETRSSLRGLRAPDSQPPPQESSTEDSPGDQQRPLHGPTDSKTPQPAPSPRSRRAAKENIRVAVIDTGVDSFHPELADFIERESAWDFITDAPRADDSHGHGTHIAGLIVREAKVSNLKIIPLRYYADGLSGGEALRHSIRAFYRAIALGVDVINYSGGGAKPSREELDALRAANAAGILVVAASGNEGSDADHAPFYPASYGLPNLISVTATNSARELLPTSNWGKSSVQLAAVGEDLVSTLPGGRSGKMTGTSQATALVTGAAVRLIAELRRRDLDVSPEMLRAALEISGTREAQLIGRTTSARFFELEQVLRRREAGWQREPTGSSLGQWRKNVAHRILRSSERDVAQFD